MEQFDDRVRCLGISREISSVQDGLNLHSVMVQIGVKLHFAQDPLAMPHYRGEQKFGWDIMPGISRVVSEKATADEARELERGALEEFEMEVKTKISKEALRTLFYNEKHGKDWDLLFQAQHAGIKTSLLDWTPEILQGLFFATEESKVEDIENSDAQLWVFLAKFDMIKSHNDFPVKDSFYEQDPSSLSEGYLINSAIFLDDLESRLFESRMYKQKGRFYLSPKESFGIAMNKQKEVAPLLFRFIIPASHKGAIRGELKERGITRDYLYVEENPAHQAIVDDVNQRIYSR